MQMSRRTDGTAARGAQAAPDRVDPQFRFGLLPKIVAFLLAVLIPLAAISSYVSVQALESSMKNEFTSKGTAIANSLASSSVDLIVNRDASTVQALLDQFAAIQGVAYVMVYDAQHAMIAHTFVPVVPKGIIEMNPVSGATSSAQVREIQYADPVSSAKREIIDIGVPMLAGTLGTVRVGMNKAIIAAAARQAGYRLLGIFAAVAAVAIAVGVVFARRLTRPIGALVRVAQRVGQGDLTRLAPVSSRDEIGQMAATFNDSIIRLRTLVQTAAERDEERKQREALQRNIVKFLDTVVEIGKGDFTKRGEVTVDVLGNVVDAINLMVEELAEVVGDVRQVAQRVASGSTQMTDTIGQVMAAAQAQAREATNVSTVMAEMTLSVRRVADNADQSAKAAGQTLDAAQKGERAARDTLMGMQQIRAEVQTISKKIKGLGDRSLEISDIVGTIQDIASQTHLLALNASIEAAGAGEAGLRFAVVADEVRKLAERATQATKDISTLIRNVQAETQEAVVAMEEGTKEVESGYQVTLKAAESLQEIARISQTAAALAGDISLASQKQVDGAESAAGAVQSIAGAAAYTEREVTHGRQTVDELTRLAEELTAKLARFKLAA
jgi:twitching motility protein PilJ